jgi:hypothetical protein
MPRPSKLTPETVTRIDQAIRMGATYELACKFAGISYQTFRNWITRAEAELQRRDNPNVKEGTKQWVDEQPYVELFDALQKAEGDAAVGWLAKIEKAANDGNWQAAAWKLERRYPADYNRNRTEVTGADGGSIRTQQTNVNIAAESAHDASNILKQLAELGAIPSVTSQSHHDTDTE